MIEIREFYQRVLDEVRKQIVGLNDVIESVMICILSGEHALLEGVPGLAKTQLVKTLSTVLGCTMRRIQFTPDLLPSDVVGTEIYDPAMRSFTPRWGPIVEAHIVLADEINRAPPKTQAALLEVMQERQVTIGGVTRRVRRPFFVLATQNPIEQEGTFPLPEAQLDRFMMKIRVGYPSEEEEMRIVKLVVKEEMNEVKPVATPEDIVRLQDTIRREVKLSEEAIKYAVDICRRSREHEYLLYGAGPRATIHLVKAALVRAALYGRDHVTSYDIRQVAHNVLRHRLILSPRARIEGLTEDDVIDDLIASTPLPEEERRSIEAGKEY